MKTLRKSIIAILMVMITTISVNVTTNVTQAKTTVKYIEKIETAPQLSLSKTAKANNKDGNLKFTITNPNNISASLKKNISIQILTNNNQWNDISGNFKIQDSSNKKYATAKITYKSIEAILNDAQANISLKNSFVTIRVKAQSNKNNYIFASYRIPLTEKLQINDKATIKTPAKLSTNSKYINQKVGKNNKIIDVTKTTGISKIEVKDRSSKSDYKSCNMSNKTYKNDKLQKATLLYNLGNGKTYKLRFKITSTNGTETIQDVTITNS